MNNNIAIKIENLSKQYRLGVVGTGTISHDLKRWYTINIMGKEDPYLKIGEVNDRAKKGQSEYVWALQDINVDIENGEVVGIIGKNGAGKSTLLKILSKVTKPSKGSITYKGRIASLLEVGTGFHPELTGRENIFMNGAIMGMTKKEIANKLDEIIDFAGVERYIDTPVKRYSSGMTVRLGFAIAAHLEPDILVVDEVLAVGDAEFQRKAIGKMQDVSRGAGRTVLFVSHNMVAVKDLCSRSILLEDGKIATIGNTSDVVNRYLLNNTHTGTQNNYWQFDEAPGKEKIRIKSAFVEIEEGKNFLNVNSSFKIVTEFWCLHDGFPINVSLVLNDDKGRCVFNIFTENKPLKKGLHKAVFYIPKQLMNVGQYFVNNMFVTDSKSYFYHENSNSFEIQEERITSGWYGEWIGAVRPTFIEKELVYID